jgi:NAD(P)-dependent dehydrogenase (short-subunit alcohol dehydrogenase family)
VIKPHLLIVGGTKGLGCLTARMLVDGGYRVSVIARHSPDKAHRIPQVSYWKANLTDPKGLQSAIRNVVERNGRFSSIVCFQRYRGKENEWRGEIETSLTGTKNLLEFSPSHFDPSGGAIVVVTSVNAFLISRHLSLGYHVGKAGMNQLVRYYAAVLGPSNIRVNSVSPATLLKEETKDFFLKRKRLLRVYEKMIPLGRIGTAEELAKTVMFLCSDGASFITGQDIILDGGLTILYQEALVRELMETQ